MSFEPSRYGAALAPLLGTDRRCPLDAGTPNQDALPLLQSLSVDAAFPQGVADASLAECCLAGVWLLHNYLDRSHAISQGVATGEGSYWHGVMHRREGDWSNAKYWFRNVGEHPVLDQLAEQHGGWDPYEFVDDCQDAVLRGADRDRCLDQQQAEWESLFEWCWSGACGAR